MSSYIGDRTVNDLDPRRRNVAMVFQNYALYPHMTVFENIAFGLRARRAPKSDIKTRVERTSRALGLADLLERKPRQLSGGQPSASRWDARSCATRACS